jgi:hypothetical protein
MLDLSELWSTSSAMNAGKHIHPKKMSRFLKRALDLHLCTALDDLRSYLCSSQVRSAVAVQSGHRNVRKDSSREQEVQPPQGY